MKYRITILDRHGQKLTEDEFPLDKSQSRIAEVHWMISFANWNIIRWEALLDADFQAFNKDIDLRLPTGQQVALIECQVRSDYVFSSGRYEHVFPIAEVEFQ